TVSGGIIELVRNTPQLVQIFFFYIAVLQTLPQARNSLTIGNVAFLNIRGIFLPTPIWGETAGVTAFALLACLVIAVALWHRRVWVKSTWRPAVGSIALALPVIVLIVGWRSGAVTGFDVPELRGFNFRGGVQIPPELAALWFGLSVYSSAFIAEIVRGAMQ